MRRFVIISLAAVLCFWGCNKEKKIVEGSRFPLKEAVIDISAEFNNKAVKKGWAEGDRINIWFDEDYSQDSPDLVLCYDGASWAKESVRDDVFIGESGTLCALYETTNDLGEMYKEKTATSSVYRGGNFMGDPKVKCTPMLVAANARSYSYDPSTTKLTADIKGWEYLTRIKVVVTGLSSTACNYALKVYRPDNKLAVTLPYVSFGPQKDENSSKAAIAGTTSTSTYYAGGVQEGNDTVAFYFKGFSAEIGKSVYFGMRFTSASDKLYVIKAKNDIEESKYGCKSIHLDFTKFSEIIDGGIAAESVGDGGDVDFEDRPPLPADEYTYTQVKYNMQPGSPNTYTGSARTVDGMNWMVTKMKFDSRDRWGGFEGVKPDKIVSKNADGYWRTGLWHGKKVFVDPDGNVALLAGINCVVPEPLASSWYVNDEGRQGYYNKFGTSGESSAQEWAQWSSSRLSDYGFNLFSVDVPYIRSYRRNSTLGWSISETTESILRNVNGFHRLSQTENPYFLRLFREHYGTITGKEYDANDQSFFTLMFDEAFIPECQSLINFVAKASNGPKFASSRQFVGYMLDNELEFVDQSSRFKKKISLKEFINLPTDPGAAGFYRCNPAAKQWALDWMQENYSTTEYSSSMEKDFVKDVARYYFRTLCDVIRQEDPNHLIMGCRLHDTAKGNKDIVEACAEYCDVVTVNLYGYWDWRDFLKDANYPAWVGEKPVVITEFYNKDNNAKDSSGKKYGNYGGGGWLVNTQKERGICYQNFCISYIESADVAGWMYFKWHDEYYKDNNSWVNKGLYTPGYGSMYTDCIDKMRQLNYNEYQILKYYYE